MFAPDFVVGTPSPLQADKINLQQMPRIEFTQSGAFYMFKNLHIRKRVMQEESIYQCINEFSF